MSDTTIDQAGVGDDDQLDGLCDLDFEMGPETTDELLPWVVLFADLLDTEQVPRHHGDVILRAQEWRALFGGE